MCAYCHKKCHNRLTCPMRKTWKDKKHVKTNKPRPNKSWYLNTIIPLADVLNNIIKTPIMVSGYWLLMTRDRRKVYVPRSDIEEKRNNRLWGKLEKKDNRFWYNW